VAEFFKGYEWIICLNLTLRAVPKKLLNLIMNPIALLKWSRTIVNSVIYVGVGISLLILSSVAILNYWVVPNVTNWRSSIEQLASDYIGATVKISQIKSDSTGLIPSFVIEGLTLKSLSTSGEDEVLNIPKVSFGFSLVSIMRLSFDQILVEGPNLSLTRDSTGRIVMAGLPTPSGSDKNGADWFFSQSNIQVQRASILWNDQTGNYKPIEFTDVDIILASGLKSHFIKLEATPPQIYGKRFSLQGNFTESLLSAHAGDFKYWSGNAQLTLPEIDLALAQEQLPHNDALAIESAKGWLRIEAGFKKGRVTQLTADLNFPEISSNYDKIYKINLKDVGGRLALNIDPKKREFKSVDFKCTTQDGAVWNFNNAYFSWTSAPIKPTTGSQANPLPLTGTGNPLLGNIFPDFSESGYGEVGIDKATLGPIKNQLKNVSSEFKIFQNLKDMEIEGELSKFKVSWSFDGKNSRDFMAQGDVSNFKFDRAPNQEVSFLKGVPGVENANIHFNVQEASGSAVVAIENGSITLSRFLDEPTIKLKEAHAQLNWFEKNSEKESEFGLRIEKANFVNEDGQGRFDLNWISKKSAGSDIKEVIDLNGTLDKVQANQVYKYLPNKIDLKVRKHLQDSVTQGALNEVAVKIKGPLDKFPFINPKDGEYRISAHAKDLSYQYPVNNSTDLKGGVQAKVWPGFIHLNTELIIDRKSINIKKATTKLATPMANSIEVTDLSAEIPDYFKPVVILKSKAKGPLSDVLKVISTTSIAELLGASLTNSQASGGSFCEYFLNLNLPLSDLSQSKITGGIIFANNDLLLSPNLPVLNKVRGTLNFNETGFSLNGVKARILGSETKFDGGLKFGADRPELNVDNSTLKIQGQISSDGLRQVKEIPALIKASKYLSGQTNYSASAVVRKGQIDLELNSSLQGMAILLPAPLGKSGDSQLPLKLVMSELPETVPPNKVLPLATTPIPSVQNSPIAVTNNTALSQVLSRKVFKTSLFVGQILSMSMLTDFSPEPVSVVNRNPRQPNLNTNLSPNPNSNPSVNSSTALFTSAWIGVSSISPPQIPPQLEPGVFVSVELPKLDADTWERVITDSLGPTEPVKEGNKENTKNSKKDEASSPAVQSRSFPIGLKIKAGEMVYSRRSIHQVSLDANYQEVQPNGQWHLNINSTEAKGAVDYKMASASTASKIYARMSLLNIPPTEVDSVDSLLNEKDTLMPTLDIGIDELEIKGKKLGHAEIEAINQIQSDGRKEWRINKFNLSVPEGKFQANGVWALMKNSEKLQNAKKTTLNFTLDVDDAGLLLDRFGTKGAVAGGKGKLVGQVSWLGSPIQHDYSSLAGNFNVNIEKGSFLKTEPGAARLLGVLNLQALPRRLFLDFKDIFSDGFSFDLFRGDVIIESGIAKTNNLQMKSVNAAILMEGSTDITKETQRIKVVVIPEIDAGTASLVVAAINPIVGITSYLAQYFLKKPISQAATKDFLIEGTWSDPVVTKIDSKFENKTDTKPTNKQ